MDRLSDALMAGTTLQLNGPDWMGSEGARPAHLPADELRRVLASPPSGVDPKGLTIEGALITGELDLAQLAVAFPVTFSACRFEKPISAVDARLRSLDFTNSQLSGVDLSQATIDGNLGMDGATLNADADGTALGLVLARILGGWIATNGFNAQGSVRAHGVNVAGFLVMEGTIAGGEDGVALSLIQAHLGGGWHSNGLHVRGEVAARGITVDGPLRLDGSTFRNPGGVALNLEQARLNGGLFATDGFCTEGEFLANGLRVGGQLNLDGATLSNRSDVPAIDGHTDERVALRLEQATITGTWYARNGFCAEGEIRIQRTSIGGQFDLSRATFSNPRETAMSLTQSKIGGDWLAADGFSVDGDLRAHGLGVDGHINLEGATLGGDLLLEEVSASRLILPETPPDGFTFLAGCDVGALATSDTPPKLGGAAGLKIGDLYGPMREDVSLTINWLRDAIWFVPQPWEELAKVYSRNGQPGDARRLRVSAARETTKHAKLWSRIARTVHGATVGYGYHPLWSVVWLGAIFVAVGVIGWCAPQAFVATSTTAAAFDPWTYALATTGPASAVVAPDWAPSAPGYAAILYALTGLKAASWVLTALFLAGITGLLRKDHA